MDIERLEALALAQDNRITTRRNQFQLMRGGVELPLFNRSELDIVLLGVAQPVFRIFYAQAYTPGSERVKPTCWSNGGEVPEPTVPVEQRQSSSCATCRQNQPGSVIKESMALACLFRRILVVVLATDEERTPYMFTINGQSTYGSSLPDEGRYSLVDYDEIVNDQSAVVTRLSFDDRSSTPKVLFQQIAPI